MKKYENLVGKKWGEIPREIQNELLHLRVYACDDKL